jgi:hypothetical protein
MPKGKIWTTASTPVIIATLTLAPPSVIAQEPSKIDAVVTASWMDLQSAGYPVFQVESPVLVSQSNYFAQFRGSDWTKSSDYQYYTSVAAPQVFAIW